MLFVVVRMKRCRKKWSFVRKTHTDWSYELVIRMTHTVFDPYDSYGLTIRMTHTDHQSVWVFVSNMSFFPTTGHFFQQSLKKTNTTNQLYKTI